MCGREKQPVGTVKIELSQSRLRRHLDRGYGDFQSRPLGGRSVVVLSGESQPLEQGPTFGRERHHRLLTQILCP